MVKDDGMRIGIVGVGAMGSVYGALFVEAGHDVVAVDTWDEHVAAINDDGLTVTGFTGDRTVRLMATTDASTAGACDMWVLATKVHTAAAAAASIAPLLRTGDVVVAIQNGLGAADRLADAIDPSVLLLGVAQGFGAAIVEPGHVHHNGMQMLRLGEPGGGMTDRLRTIEAVWAGAGFPAAAFDDIEQLIWEKFVCNVAVGGPCLVSGLTAGGLLASDEWRPVAMGCATEAYEVGRALGVEFSYDDPVAYVDAFVSRVPHAKPSMLQDHEAGRPSEVEAINGQVPVLGRRLGIATPHNDAVCARVADLEAQH